MTQKAQARRFKIREHMDYRTMRLKRKRGRLTSSELALHKLPTTYIETRSYIWGPARNFILSQSRSIVTRRGKELRNQEIMYASASGKR
jgi:hypothetical protein